LTGPVAPLEVELKLAVEPAALAAVGRHPAVRALAQARPRTARVISTYYDTPDRRLRDAGVALRMRRSGRTWLMTVKGRAGDEASLSVRPEYEWPVRRGEIDTMRLATTPWRSLFTKALAKGGLAPVFTTDFRRRSIAIAFEDGTRATLAVDDGRIDAIDRAVRERPPPSGQADLQRISEIEIEVAAGDPMRAVELARVLAADLPLRVEPRSKAARGYALADRVAARPVRALDPAMHDGLGARAAAAAVVSECLRQIEGNAPYLPDGTDPEWIHQMRIGVRRLRSSLSLNGRLHDAAAVEALKLETRWLLDALGPARDLDVFALETLPAARADLASLGSADTTTARLLTNLVPVVARRRRHAREQASEAVTSSRFLQLVLDARRLALASAIAADEDGQEARAFAIRRLDKRARGLARAGTKLASAGTDERHAVRIAAKKLRYATEFFAPLFPAKRTRAFRRALAALQQVLGEFNDAAVAPRVCAPIAGPAAPATAAIAAWSAARAAQMGPRIEVAWRDFERTPPFWKRTKHP